MSALTLQPDEPAIATDDVVAFIADNLPVAPVPGIPEIRLHGAHPGSGLRRVVERRSKLSPYWAYQWAGGAVLARHLLDHSETVQGLTVLDLGTGSGLVAIAAAKAGAGKVIAADIDAHAIAALRLNAALNDVAVQPVLADLTIGEPPHVDLVMVGDLFYEPRLARRVTTFLDRCLAARIAVLVGDPGRTHLPRKRLKTIAEYQVTDFGAAGPATPATVFAFIRES